MTSGPGMGTYRPRVELALLYTTPSQSEIGRLVGLGIISTLCGEVSIPGDVRVRSGVVGVVYVCVEGL